MTGGGREDREERQRSGKEGNSGEATRSGRVKPVEVGQRDGRRRPFVGDSGEDAIVAFGQIINPEDLTFFAS